MKKSKKIVSFAMVTAMMLGTAIAPVNAEVTKIIAEKDNKVYVYDMQQILQSAVAKALGNDAPLYDHYIGANVKQVFDDIKGYIDMDDVINAAVQAKLKGESFNLNAYTEEQAPVSEEVSGDKYEVDLEGNETPVAV